MVGSREQQTTDYDSFENLLSKSISVFDKINNLKSFQAMVDKAFQCEFKTTDQAKKLRCKENLGKCGSTRLSWKYVSACVFITVCIAVFGQPVITSTHESLLFSHPISKLMPAELRNQMEKFYMNLEGYCLRAFRRFIVYWRIVDALKEMGIAEKLMDTEDNCLLHNPFIALDVVERPKLCKDCEDTSVQIYRKRDTETISEERIANFSIHLFKGFGKKVSLDVLRFHISNNPTAIKFRQSTFISHFKSITTLEDLGKENLIAQLKEEMRSGGHLVWSTEHYAESYVMRQIFPKHREILPDPKRLKVKTILLNGNGTSSYKFDIKNNEHAVMYIQGQGSRKIRLAPEKKCVFRCGTHAMTMREQDILVYDPKIWTAYSMHTKNHTSLAFIGEFDF